MKLPTYMTEPLTTPCHPKMTLEMVARALQIEATASRKEGYSRPFCEGLRWAASCVRDMSKGQSASDAFGWVTEKKP